jgi:Arc/MetJ family transcription regulator
MTMRTTINVDEALLAEAQRLTGQTERTAVIHEGLKALIERERARRLTGLGDSDPGGTAGRVRRAPTDDKQPPAREVRPVLEVLAEIRAAQKARGHVPPTREEVDRYLAEERASWDR